MRRWDKRLGTRKMERESTREYLDMYMYMYMPPLTHHATMHTCNAKWPHGTNLAAFLLSLSGFLLPDLLP